MGAGVTVRYDKMVWIYIISCHSSKIWLRYGTEGLKTALFSILFCFYIEICRRIQYN